MTKQTQKAGKNYGCNWYLKLLACILVGVAVGQIPPQVLPKTTSNDTLSITILIAVLLSATLTWVGLDWLMARSSGTPKKAPAQAQATPTSASRTTSYSWGVDVPSLSAAKKSPGLSYKVAAPLACLLAPALLVSVPAGLSANGAGITLLSKLEITGLSTLLLAAYFLVLYAIAGGFEWSTTKRMSGLRVFLFCLLGGLLYAFLLYEVWILVRFILSKIYGQPFRTMMGRLLVNSSLWVVEKTRGYHRPYRVDQPIAYVSLILVFACTALGAVPRSAVVTWPLYRAIYPPALVQGIVRYVPIWLLVIIGLVCGVLLYVQGMRKAESVGWTRSAYFMVIFIIAVQIFLVVLIIGVSSTA